MYRQTQSGLKIECVLGDIANQPDADAIVNSANTDSSTEGGVARAIHRAAGSDLALAYNQQPLKVPGQAIITPGFELPNQFVIHCLGPIYGSDIPSDRLLRECYQNALRLADGHQVARIAFPAIGTGPFGFPMDSAAQIAMRSFVDEAPYLRSVKSIRFVLISHRDLRIHVLTMEKLVA